MTEETSSPKLTSRELECLTLVAKGSSNAQIASLLGISIAGANFHVSNALRRLGAANRAHAVAVAIANGLIPADVAREP